MPDDSPLFPISRQHLEALTGELGIMQHAIGEVPDPAHGYCVDDVARALETDLLHGRVLGWEAVEESARRSLRFLEAAMDAETGRFKNIRLMSGAWVRGIGSEDSHGRAMLALGNAVASSPDASFVDAASLLFARGLPATRSLAAIRSRASGMLACVAVLDGTPGVGIAVSAAAVLGDLATTMLDAFQAGASPGWPWPEGCVTYENGLLPRALIVAGRVLGDPEMLQVGLTSLDWLIDVQTAADGHLSPIGNGWWPRGGTRSQFDQQPIEATALLLAAEAAYDATNDDRYSAAIERAYGWFLGENDVGLTLADPARGSSFDGLTPTGVNRNEGAESTLMWLIAAEHVRALRSARPKLVAAAR